VGQERVGKMLTVHKRDKMGLLVLAAIDVSDNTDQFVHFDLMEASFQM
jgi:hypothetical protein